MRAKGKNLRKSGIGKILLIQLGDIGDVVLSLPCIRALKAHFPEADMVVAVREKAAGLLEDCRWVHEVLSVDTSRRKPAAAIRYQRAFFARLRRFRFDLAVDLSTGQRGALLAFLSGAPQRVGFFAYDGRLWRNRLFTHLVLPYAQPGTHVVEQYLSLLECYGITTMHKRPELDVSIESRKAAAALLRAEGVAGGQPVIAVQPFSLWRYKEWGERRYIQLIDRITSEYPAAVIIVGSSNERNRAEKIAGRCRRNTVNLAGKTPIRLLAALLSECCFFIGGDSAGIHISAAVGTPTLGIFGPSAFVDWAPRGGRHGVVVKDLPCVPCRQKGCEGSGISRCLETLSVEEVMARVRERVPN